MDSKRETPAAGTTDEMPRWEGPPETRPRGYLPATDDPASRPDAAGETLRNPDRDEATDVWRKEEAESRSDEDGRSDEDRRAADDLAAETGIPTESAARLVKAYGTDRPTLLKAARALPQARS